MALRIMILRNMEKAIKKESVKKGQMDGYKRGHKDELEHGITPTDHSALQNSRLHKKMSFKPFRKSMTCLRKRQKNI